MLAALGVEPGATVSQDHLALALQGRNAVTGERLRKEGWIHQPASDEEGRPLYDRDGRREKTRVLGTKSVDLTFSAPKSVSVLWSQASYGIRARIEPAMVAAAGAMVESLTRTKSVVAHRGGLEAAGGFAAAAALHVRARTASGEGAPAPQLHVHGVLVGVERSDGYFASPELSGLFRHGAPLEGGAIARVRLAEALAEMGFEVEGNTGRQRRFFEVRGVPQGLMQRLSGRTRDVDTGIKRLEAEKGRRITDGERAVVALETRAPKRVETPEETVAMWRAHAADFDFGPAEVEALQGSPGFSTSIEGRQGAVREASLSALRRRAKKLSAGEVRATVFESAAGRLRLADATALLDGMERSGELAEFQYPSRVRRA